jgi:hypothetical protein
MSTRALYYPFIRPRSDEWLKRAALVWHAVERIVPPGYDPKDSRTARVLAQNGILVSLNPADSVSAIKDQFLAALTELNGQTISGNGTDSPRRSARCRFAVASILNSLTSRLRRGSPGFTRQKLIRA